MTPQFIFQKNRYSRQKVYSSSQYWMAKSKTICVRRNEVDIRFEPALTPGVIPVLLNKDSLRYLIHSTANKP